VAPVSLIASSDDYLLEERMNQEIASACDALGGAEPEVLPPETTPEALAVELCSPSLFAPQRVLVAPDVRLWLGAPAPRGGLKGRTEEEEIEADALVQVLDEGVAEDIALVMGAWCGAKPQGPLVAAVEEAGGFHWESLPEPPKPWEDVAVSKEQEAVLRKILHRAVGEVQFTEAAVRLLLDRLGFAPRLLAQEGRKLAAAGGGQPVDEELVRALSFPKERSLDVVRDAVLARNAAPILDILNAAEAGVAVRNWQGEAVDPRALPPILLSQTASLFQQLLYLRRVAANHDLLGEMAPSRTQSGRWYSNSFKTGIGPELFDHLEADKPSPVLRAGARKPTMWNIGLLFSGAGRYSDAALIGALADLGGVEAGIRGDMPIETLTRWFAAILD
jgi:hypothetical protein